MMEMHDGNEIKLINGERWSLAWEVSMRGAKVGELMCTIQLMEMEQAEDMG